MGSQTQMRAGGFGVIVFDYPAMELVAEKMGLDFSMAILRKVQAVERHILKKQGEKNG